MINVISYLNILTPYKYSEYFNCWSCTWRGTNNSFRKRSRRPIPKINSCSHEKKQRLPKWSSHASNAAVRVRHLKPFVFSWWVSKSLHPFQSSCRSLSLSATMSFFLCISKLSVTSPVSHIPTGIWETGDEVLDPLTGTCGMPGEYLLVVLSLHT